MAALLYPGANFLARYVRLSDSDQMISLQPVSTSKWEFSPLVTLSPQEITLMIIFNFCTFLSFYLFLLLPMFLRLTAGLSNWHITASHFFSFASFLINPTVNFSDQPCHQLFRSLVLDLRGHICLN